ncbi:MAG: hypothetical protein J6M47_02625 [Clostridia bacterium]|nr:hypothetical protein [Clostridia bacterium]
MRPIDADSLKAQLIYFANHMQDNGHSTYAAALGEAINIVDRRQTIDAVHVQHEGNTSFISVKNVDEWEDRIILDEGVKTKRCAVYYADADEPVERCNGHGRWLDERTDIKCSECGATFSDEIVFMRRDTDSYKNPEHCPACGVRMDGEPDDDSGQ